MQATLFTSAGGSFRLATNWPTARETLEEQAAAREVRPANVLCAACIANKSFKTNICFHSSEATKNDNCFLSLFLLRSQLAWAANLHISISTNRMLSQDAACPVRPVGSGWLPCNVSRPFAGSSYCVFSFSFSSNVTAWQRWVGAVEIPA